MEKQVFMLLLCVLSITEGIPVSSQLSLAPPHSSPAYTFLVPVRVLGSNGPQVVLVPMSSDWGTRRNQNPPAQSERTLTLAETEQHHGPQMPGQTVLENENLNSPFLQLPTASPDTPLPENPLPQGQVLPPVWNNIPGVVPLQPGMTGQMFVPVWAPPAGGAAEGQIQSNSASSEEGDAQVIYILPVSAEIPNMGVMEGGRGGVAELRPDPNPNANLHLSPDPNPNPSPGPAPGSAPGPALLAGVQEKADSLGRAPPSEGAAQTTETGGVTTSCNHQGEAANAKANTPSL